MKKMQEDGFANTGFSSEMEDLKNGRLFHQPEGYFDELEAKLFAKTTDQNPILLKPEKTDSRQRLLTLWLGVAASVALLIYFVGVPSPTPKAESYTNTDIIDYLEYSDVDMIEIVESLDHIPEFDEEMSDKIEVYYEYIAENLVDFEDIIY
ncbi:hypothetical protein [Membranihabitans marinus]|uniref:hypothetical protein n=1 Tax=Membranihabitans marinus TaxID=1227546 RepID=UPI001F213D44|nr:hypothetical protein [Membranihabitans marinus]